MLIAYSNIFFPLMRSIRLHLPGTTPFVAIALIDMVVSIVCKSKKKELIGSTTYPNFNLFLVRVNLPQYFYLLYLDRSLSERKQELAGI